MAVQSTDAPARNTPKSAPRVPAPGRFQEISVDGVSGRIDRSLINRVRRLVTDYPDRAIEVLRTWMAEGYRH